MARLGTAPRVGTWHTDRDNLVQVAKVALAFINDSAASTHGAVRVDSVLISPSGEWKLGGFELLSNSKDDAAVLYVRRVRYDASY